MLYHRPLQWLERGLGWLERYSQDGFCISFEKQLACRFIRRITGRARKDGQSKQKKKMRRKGPHSASDYSLHSAA